MAGKTKANFSRQAPSAGKKEKSTKMKEGRLKLRVAFRAEQKEAGSPTAWTGLGKGSSKRRAGDKNK